MHGHPNTPLSDRELFNFSIFLRANPHLTSSDPQAAFDALPAGLKRTGKAFNKGIPTREFSPGGKYDAARVGVAFDEAERKASPKAALDLGALRELATKMSPEGWAAIREACLKGGAEDEEEDDQERKLTAEEREELERSERAADQAFGSRHPDTSRITGYSTPKAKKRVPTSAASAKRFAERFPDASRITIRVG